MSQQFLFLNIDFFIFEIFSMNPKSLSLSIKFSSQVLYYFSKHHFSSYGKMGARLLVALSYRVLSIFGLILSPPSPLRPEFRKPCATWAIINRTNENFVRSVFEKKLKKDDCYHVEEKLSISVDDKRKWDSKQVRITR